MGHETTHILDPDGDVVLVLRNPNAPFAIWNIKDEAEDAPSSNSFNLAINKKKDKKKKKRARAIIYDDTPAPDETPTEAPPEEMLIPAPEPSVHSGSTPVDYEPQHYEDESLLLTIDTDEEPEIKFLVSSRHLILASGYFNAKFTGPWKEASVDSTDGLYHLEASDWDPDALLILMQVIHGRTRIVPRQVSLDMLARIAVVVDYYDCHEVIEVFSSIWIDDLKKGLPAEYGRNLILWLLISLVFQKDEIFLTITKTTILESTTPVPTLGLPISSTVIACIDLRRMYTIEFIFNALEKLRMSFLAESTTYSFAQSCSLLGALEKEMHGKRMLDPKPEKPYIGYSVAAIEKQVLGFRNPENHNGYYHISCNLVGLIAGELGSRFEAHKKGLRLDSFIFTSTSTI